MPAYFLKKTSFWIPRLLCVWENLSQCTQPMTEENVLKQICLLNRAQQSLSLSATAGSIQQNKHTNTEEPREQLFLLTEVYQCGSPGQCATTQSCGSGLHWEYTTIYTHSHTLVYGTWFQFSFLFGISLKVMSVAPAFSPSLTHFYLTRIVPLSSSRNKKTHILFILPLLHSHPTRLESPNPGECLHGAKPTCYQV